MAENFDRICDINADRETWKLKVRLIRLWGFPNAKNPAMNNSLEMVLIDEAGGKIHATLGKRYFYKFESLLTEGRTYTMSNFIVDQNTGAYRTTKHEFKLGFQYRTVVRTIPDFNVSLYGFSFTPFNQIIDEGPEVPYLVDVIGLLSKVATERDYERDGKKQRMNVIELSHNGMRIECALFGDNYVNQLNNFLASGLNSAVVVIQFAKVKSFRGQVVLQNVMHATRLFFDSDIEEVKELKKNLKDGMDISVCSQSLSQLSDHTSNSIEDDFLRITPKKTIEQIHTCQEDIVCVVLAKIMDVDEGDKWWYTACKCNKAMQQKNGLYHCGSCNVFSAAGTLRYRLKVVVDDESDCASFVIFDRDASYLFGKTCADMLEDVLKVGDVDDLPSEFKQLVNRQFLFKVEVKYSPTGKNEPSYRVVKLSDDPTLIQNFKKIMSNNVVVSTPTSIKHTKEPHLDGNVDSVFEQNLMAQFTENAGESLSDTGVTPSKRIQDEVIEVSAGDFSSNKSKVPRVYAKIKKEKD